MLVMKTSRNLVSDSPLVQETFDLIRDRGGRANFIEIAETVLRLTNVDKNLAASVVNDLVQNDPRFVVDADYLCAADNELEFHQLHEIEFVVFDVEAVTGRSGSARIIELGGYRVRNGQILDGFQSLIHPEVQLPRFVSELTGISDDMLTTAPKFADVAPVWLNFIDDAVLVAHNSSFDLSLLNRELARAYPGRRLRNRHLCTVDLAQRLMPQIANHKLDSLAAYFGFEIARRHRAPDDALAAARIFLRLLDELSINGICTLAQARQFQKIVEVDELQLAFDV